MKTIATIPYDCPLCEQVHDISLRQSFTTTEIKQEEIEYEEIQYYCDVEDASFCPSRVMNENLQRARDVYRMKKQLLTSTQIKQIRESYGLTQKEYAQLLGLGDVTIQRYETKLIQDPTYDSIMRLTYEKPTYCYSLLQLNRAKFSEKRFGEISANISARSFMTQTNYVYEGMQNAYLQYLQPCVYNGYMVLQYEKMNAILGYFATFIKPLYKVKLMKLLWYMDALSYKMNHHSLSGLVYQHLPLGAVPLAHDDLLKFPAIEVIETEYHEYTSFQILPKADVNLAMFSTEDIDVMQAVIHKFDTFNTSNLVAYMHEEDAYQQTVPNEIISYELMRDIREF